MTKTEMTSRQLQALSQDNIRFDGMIEALRADRSIRTTEMREIAEGFLGHQIKKSFGRAAALQQIISRQAVDARQTARANVIGQWAGRAW